AEPLATGERWLGRADLDRDDTARLHGDRPGVHAGGADRRVVGVRVAAPYRARRAAGRAREREPLADAAAEEAARRQTPRDRRWRRRRARIGERKASGV